MWLIKKSVRTRVAFFIAAAILSMTALSTILIVDSRNRIAAFHLENAKTALKASLAMLQQDQRLVEEGEVTLEEAQARALSQLRKFRYDDGEGYVAILEDDGFMAMHPSMSNSIRPISGTFRTSQEPILAGPPSRLA